jgi:predicted patatin/cPLA2 family phospholipase
MNHKANKRALVISGGGSKGAFGGGIAEFLTIEQGIHYDIFVGTSTGSLLIPFIAAGEIDTIKQVYTSVTQSSIFSNCPFHIKKTGPETFKSSFNHLGIVWQFLRGRSTFGESKNLRKLIRKTLTNEIFKKLKELNKYIIVTVSNLTYNIIEYKYLRDCTYDEFCDWIWISSNLIPFMSLVQKNNCEYADGGFGDLVPIQEAINLGAEIIDVIILNPRHQNTRTPHSSNAFNLMLKGFNFMLNQIGKDDVNLSLLESRFEDVEIRLIHTPRKLIDNAFIFDPQLMTKWWQEGLEFGRTSYTWKNEIH